MPSLQGRGRGRLISDFRASLVCSIIFRIGRATVKTEGKEFNQESSRVENTNIYKTEYLKNNL